MSLIAWPAALVASAETPYWRILGASASGGRSPVGNDQTIASPAALWAVSLSIPCFTREKLLAAIGLVAALDGRANTLAVGPTPSMRMPWRIDPRTGNAITPARGDPTNPDLDATLAFALAEDLPLNAMHARITRTKGGALATGMHFSLGGEMKIITGLDAADAGKEGVTLGASFRPWIRKREGYAAATVAAFGRPLATMQLASDDAGQLQVDLARTGVLTLDLIEAV